MKTALQSGLPDFEDAIIEAVALENGVEVIATRDAKNFRKSKIMAIEPSQI